jgi:spermidine synthase
MRTSLAMGLLNAAVALWATWLLRPFLRGGVGHLRALGLVLIGLLLVGLVFADRLTQLTEEELYSEQRIVYARTTPYQRIVVTRGQEGAMRLYLNGHLQFSSLDEYRYHEALVHPAMTATRPRRVLVLGGGDGLALREVLRHPGVEAVTLVDLDPGMTALSDRHPPLARLNENAYHDERVEVVNQDAYLWVQQGDPGRYDVVVIDFPDPHSYSLGKLYTTRFYKLLKRHLAPGAAVAVQCTSPLWAPRTFWCIVRTLEAAGYQVRPYHVAVPSFFGVWGFALAKCEPFEPPVRAPTGLRRPDGSPARLRFLNDQAMRSLFKLPEDLRLPPGETVEINRLDNQAVVRYHDAEWKRYAR